MVKFEILPNAGEGGQAILRFIFGISSIVRYDILMPVLPRLHPAYSGINDGPEFGRGRQLRLHRLEKVLVENSLQLSGLNVARLLFDRVIKIADLGKKS